MNHERAIVVVKRSHVDLGEMRNELAGVGVHQDRRRRRQHGIREMIFIGETGRRRVRQERHRALAGREAVAPRERARIDRLADRRHGQRVRAEREVSARVAPQVVRKWKTAVLGHDRIAPVGHGQRIGVGRARERGDRRRAEKRANYTHTHDDSLSRSRHPRRARGTVATSTRNKCPSTCRSSSRRSERADNCSRSLDPSRSSERTRSSGCRCPCWCSSRPSARRSSRRRGLHHHRCRRRLRTSHIR